MDIRWSEITKYSEDGVVRRSGIILCVCLANERRRYIVMSYLIGWAHTQNDPWSQVGEK